MVSLLYAMSESVNLTLQPKIHWQVDTYPQMGESLVERAPESTVRYTSMRKLSFYRLLLVGLLTSVAHADTNQTLEFTAYSDIYHTNLSSFSIDDQGSPNPTQQFGALRLGVGANYNAGAFGIELAADMVSFRLYGDTSPLGLNLGEDTFREPIHDGADPLWLPRTAVVQYRSGIGVFRCGQQTAHWGLGLLINDGRQRERFGAAFNGSTSMRCLFATKPIASIPTLTLLLTGDAVYRDDNAEWQLGDRAYGGSLGIRYGQNENQLGFLTSLRNQKDRTDPRSVTEQRTHLKALVADIFWQQTYTIGSQSVLWEGEIATILGDTNRPYLDETYEDGASIQSLGAATAISSTRGGHEVRLELGYASGDNDPTDDTVRHFAFHSSYGMGLIFVDHVMPALSARAVDRIDDRELINVTPPSLRFLVNQGSLQSTAYVNPTLKFKLPWDFNVTATYFYFAGGADLVDIYNSNLNGGFNTTYGGQTADGGPIGHEVNVRLGYDVSLSSQRRLRINAESGVFIPDAALNGVIDDPIYALQLTTHVQL